MTGTSRPSPFQTMSGTFLKCQQKLAIEDSLHLSQTKAECGKKRSLPIKDPSLVQDKWECKDSGGTNDLGTSVWRTGSRWELGAGEDRGVAYVASHGAHGG